MEIKCACGNEFFTKAMKLKTVLGMDGIHEEVYYVCTKCGFTVAKKEIKNYPVTKATDGENIFSEIILYRDHD